MSASDQRGLYMQVAGKVAQRVPGLRMLPVVRLLMAAEVLVVGKHHLDRVSANERGQLIALLAKAKGRPKNLSQADQVLLAAIVQKLEPRLFMAEAAGKLSPVGVPSPLMDKIAGKQLPKG